MTTTPDLAKVAEDKKQGMTLAELMQFVQSAMRLDVDGSVRLKATVGFGGQLQKVETR